MSAADEAVVRRFYEQMNNDRKLELAPELFTADHVLHDPADPRPGADLKAWPRPSRCTRTASTATGRSRRCSRPATASSFAGPAAAPTSATSTASRRRASRSASMRSPSTAMADGKIAESWEVWDTLGLLQQIGVVPSA